MRLALRLPQNHRHHQFTDKQSKTDNHKPPSLAANPSAPKLVPASPNTYNLTFSPPTAAQNKIVYTTTASTRPQHFLLYHPTTKAFTLERADQALTCNAGVYAKLHPPITASTTAGSDSGGDSELEIEPTSDDDDDSGGVYDFRHFLGRTSAAEEKRQKRLGALKRAGRDVVDIPEDEADGEDGELVIPDAPPPGSYEYDAMEEDSDMDAPGESDDDDHYSAPPPPPPPPAKKRAPAAPRAKAPPKPRAQPKKKAPQPPPALAEELVIPELTNSMPLDSGDEECSFSEYSDEDEERPAPRAAPPPPPPPQQEEEEVSDEDDGFDFDIGKELEEALGGGGGGDGKAVGLGLVFEEEDVSDEDEDQNPPVPPPQLGAGGEPKSLRELYGAEEEEEEEDSESEEE